MVSSLTRNMMGVEPVSYLLRGVVFIGAVCLCTSEIISNCSYSDDPSHGGIRVDCSKRNLTSMPHHLPENTTYLDLSHNKISQLFSLNLTELWYLDVSFNIISIFESGTFSSVSNLRELYLNDNKLKLKYTSYPRDLFLPLKNLLKLHMHNNHHSDSGSYPDDTFGSLVKLKELKIDTFRLTSFGRGFSLMQGLQNLLLGFRGCQLSAVKNETFKTFENSTVTTLDLQNCPLLNIEKNAFWNLHKLEHLQLSNAIPLTPTKAMSAMYGLRGKRMKSIQINHIFQLYSFRIGSMKERILSDQDLTYLEEVCVERFEMVNAKLTWFGKNIIDDSSKFASCVKVMDLSYNDLYGDPKILLELSLMSNLESFNISKYHGALQTRDAMIDICQPSSIHLSITLPSTLKHLNFRGIGDSLGCIHDVIFYNARNLKSADFSYFGIEGFSSKITGLESLSTLDLSGNNFVSMKPLFLGSLPKLEKLFMSNVHIAQTMVLSTTSHMLIPQRHLKTIVLSFNNLKILNPNLFSSNPIIELDLSNNRFESVPFDLTTTSLLHNLDLSFNSLTVLSETEMKHLDVLASKHNLSLNLEGNLLSCGCQNLDFVRWLYSTNVSLNFGIDTFCLTDNGSLVNISYMYAHIDDVWRQCYGSFWLSVSISTFAFILLTMTALYVVHRKKTWLLNVTLRLFGIKNVSQMLTRDDFLNDAYIGYSDADYQYICHTVRDHLENRHSLRLFIKDRDTDPGKLISHEIIRGIDTSWRCVLFLTKAFLEDSWCDFTMEYLVYVKSRRPSTRIVLILCDDVMRGDISPSLLNVVEEQRIFRFGEFMGDEGRLWKNVSQCIRLNNDS